MRRLAVLALAFLLPLVTMVDHAAAGGPPGMSEPTAPEPPTETRTKRYGYQVLLADVAWMAGSVIIANSDGGSGGGELIALGYYGGGPLVHLANHNKQGALKSLALRTLLPIAGAVGGMIVASGEGEEGMAVMGGMLLGFAGGAVGAMVIDAAVLAKREVAVPRVGGALAGLRPGMKIGKHGVTVSVAGSF